MRVFGPVPSRRLGKSIGINNIPPKHCSYACVYCQLGRALKMCVNRSEFFPPRELLNEVRRKVEATLKQGEAVDYLTIVPDGEPTLDLNLGELLRLLADLEIKTAVITNSTLLQLPEVREELSSADWVSVKVDALNGNSWKKIDRPHPKLSLDSVLRGILDFSGQFDGTLVTETMLVEGINDDAENLRETAEFIRETGAETAYVSIPTRPPAEKWVGPPKEEVINLAYQIFDEAVKDVEYLIGYEGNAFPYSGNVSEDILSITAVHPMREDAVRDYVERGDEDFSVVDRLVEAGKLSVSEYNQHRYYVRSLSLKPRNGA